MSSVDPHLRAEEDSFFLSSGSVDEPALLRRCADYGGQRILQLTASLKFLVRLQFTVGAVAQLARALAWHARGQGFDSPQLHHQGIQKPETAFY